MAHPIPEFSDSRTHRPLFRPEADSQGDSEGPASSHKILW